MTSQETLEAFQNLIDIMHRLRRECPWDQEQSLPSLRRYVLEEAYEVVEAIHEQPTKGFDPIVEELGDLLLQIVFQAEIIQESLPEKIILKEVIEGLNEKLIRRHPHVFGDESPQANSSEVLKTWELIKEKEKASQQNGFLGRIEKHLSALQRANKIGKRSTKIDFDWPDVGQVLEKVNEELLELKNASSPLEKEEEFGDLLFSLCQWARKEGIDPEVALVKSNQKFCNRFDEIEKLMNHDLKSFLSLPPDEKETLWEKAKTHLKNDKLKT